MFDWNDEELGNIIWGEGSEVDDHIVPYSEGNEVKKLYTSADCRKKQCIQESRPVKIADQEVSGPNSVLSGFKLDGIAQCNSNEARPASGAEIDSWPESPLTNVACDGEYAERNAQNSIDIQLSDFGTELHKYGSEKEDVVQPGNECEDKVDGSFLEYSWENIGSFDDLDNMFRNDDPIFGRENLGRGELWSSTADLFSSPTKSFPACSSNSGLNAMCMSDSEMKLEFVQPGIPSHAAGFGRTENLDSYDIDLTKDKTGGKEYCHYLSPSVDCIGENSKSLLEKTNAEMVETTESWNSHPAIKVDGKRKVLKYPTKEESNEGPSMGLNPPWPLAANQISSFGNQFANSSVQTAPFSINPQKQPFPPEPWLYWQTSPQYLSVADGNPQHPYPMMPTMPKVQLDRDKHQPPRVEYGNSSESLKHANCSKDFVTPPRQLDMTPQEKVDKLKRRQQMQAMLAIQKQQQHFVHKTAQTDPYDVEKCSQENQHHDTSGSTIDVEENLKIHFTKEPNSPIEHDDSNTVSMAIDDCSLEEKVLNQLQDVIGKLDIQVRLCVRDSLHRLAQSAMQRNNNTDTSSTNNTRQYDIAAERDEIYGHNRLCRIPEIETETNPIDRTVAHLLFHQPLEQPKSPVKDSEKLESLGFTKLVGEPEIEGIKNFSAGSLSDCSMDKKISSPPCMGPDTKDVYPFQSSTCTGTPKILDNTSTDCGE